MLCGGGGRAQGRTCLKVHASPLAAVAADLGDLGPGRELQRRLVKPRGERKSGLNHVGAEEMLDLRGKGLRKHAPEG